jgi:hypothetical protein
MTLAVLHDIRAATSRPCTYKPDGVIRRGLRRLCRYSDQVRAQRNMRQKQSFGHASYSPGLAQFLDIFEPTKWRAFDAGNAQSGVGLQDGVARAMGFGDAPGHR